MFSVLREASYESQDSDIVRRTALSALSVVRFALCVLERIRHRDERPTIAA
jgi:hypothetical protein